jgi:hypothetical protein
VRSFEYVKRVHLGEAHWLGAAAFSPEDLDQRWLYGQEQGARCPRRARVSTIGSSPALCWQC